MFNRGNDVLLDEKLKALRTEFELALLKQKEAFDNELEEMETALLGRIEQAEKSVRNNSLTTGQKDASEDLGPVSGGYQSWSQRKASRLMRSHDPQFSQKTLKRSQRP